MIKYVIIYTLISISLAYLLKHQLDVVKLISTKNDLKLRTKIVKKKKQIELYLKLCPVWPLLLLIELYDAIKEHTQS